MADSGARKRQRTKASDSIDASELRAKRANFLSSLSRPISPPPNSSTPTPASALEKVAGKDLGSPPKKETLGTKNPAISEESSAKANPRVSPSPIQLTAIRGLPDSDNVDAVSLHDILGDPLIKEAWIFNYCFDVDWTMKHFDPDVRDLVQVKIVHGSWRREDVNRIEIDDACRKMDNVQAIQAYLPDQFGTHHSKMMILFRHDDFAQVIIHTANMLEKDWTNMTQAVWRSPLVPRSVAVPSKKRTTSQDKIGSGATFKDDLLRYVKAYGNKLRSLREQLSEYDFSEVRAKIIASVPSKFKMSDNEVWGHVALRRAIAHIGQRESLKNSHLVCQVSSIATLPARWLDETIFKAAGIPLQMSTSANSNTAATTVSQTSIIFPTADDVARSLDGYYGGGSIHTKAQSTAHLKQIAALRPYLHRWTETAVSKSNPASLGMCAGRHLAAPHIKTYISFANAPKQSNLRPDIDWALVTSANLSQQAWGTTPKLAKGEKDPGEAAVHIQSFEIGVLLWPELFAENFGVEEEPNGIVDRESASKSREKMRMVPVFRKDTPDMPLECQDEKQTSLVGFRLPYDLPLTPYTQNELPWSPQSTYRHPDRLGRTWPPDATWFS